MSEESNSRKYRIAVFISDWNYEVINQYLHGIQDFTEQHPSCRADIFDDFGVDGKNVARNRLGPGGMEVFAIPDLTQYDGIIIEGDQGWPEIMRQYIMGTCDANDVTVTSLNYPLHGSVFVGSDNYSAQSEIVEHLFSVHHVKTLAYVSGPVGSDEADARKKAFRDVCERHGVAPEDRKEYANSWAVDEGSRAVGWIMEDGPLPDAIVCANDWLALGALSELKKRKVRVPEDVLLTGFDNIPDAQASDPRLTTVSRDYRSVAVKACQYIIDVANGVKGKTEHEYSPSCSIFSESCGCHECPVDVRAVSEMYHIQSDGVRTLYGLQGTLLPNLQAASTLQEMLEIFERDAVSELQCRWACIALNPDFVLNYSEDRPYLHYPDRMMLMAIAGKKPRGFHADRDTHVYMSFNKNEIIPKGLNDNCRTLVIYPLHDHNQNYGYVALDGLSPLSDNNVLEVILMQIAQIIASVRSRMYTRSLNEKLSDMYLTDSLTGLYNRYGFRRYGKVYVEEMLKKGRNVSFYFIDLDDMKKINDCYGHEAGDIALRIMAGVLSGICRRRGGFAMRYGGDEFLYITHDTARSLESRIQDRINEETDKEHVPFAFQVSIGKFSTDEKPGLSCEEYITEADERMYTVKKNKKIGR